MKNNDKNVLVSFEPTGASGGQSPQSIQKAFNDAVLGVLKFFDENRVRNGRVYDNSKGGIRRVYVELPESLVAKLEAKPFIGREMTGQNRSTLQRHQP